MKKTLLLVAAAAILVSCKKEYCETWSYIDYTYINGVEQPRTVPFNQGQGYEFQRLCGSELDNMTPFHEVTLEVKDSVVRKRIYYSKQ